jgi:hypothetical protein
MCEPFDKLIESMEKLKEVHRIQYDYFKFLITVCGSGFLIMIAFFEKVFEKPDCVILAIISILGFALCILGSVLALPVTGNIILYMTNIQIISARQLISTGPTKESEEEAKKKEEETKKSLKEANHLLDKINGQLKKIRIFDWWTRISFLTGMITLLFFVVINFLCR